MSDQFPSQPAPMATPLVSTDPPRIGDYWLDARLVATPSGVAYAAHDDDGTSAMLIILAAGAASDAAARDRLAGEVNRMHLDTVLARGGQGQDEGRLAEKFRPMEAPQAPDTGQHAPWVALAHDGSPAALAEAHRVLDAVGLSRTRLLGRPSGPDYQMYWRSNTAPGGSRLWPLPWPGRHDRAGWVSTLVAWLLAVLVAAMALLIAVLAFQNQPPQSPPPPVTPPPSSGGGSGSGTPQSPQSPESSSSGSGSPSQSQSGGQSPSESPSGSQGGEGSSGGSSPSPNRRLILDQGNRDRP